MEKTPVIGVACPMIFRKRIAESPPLRIETAGKVRQKIDESRTASKIFNLFFIDIVYVLLFIWY